MLTERRSQQVCLDYEVKAGLEALIALESAKRLAKLGGSEKALRTTPRRRSRN